MASLGVWNRAAEPIGSLIDVWVQIKGIPPKWVDWDTMREVASSIGLMVEMDWQTLFNSFFSLMRVKIQCKDPTRVPKERVYVFNKGLYLIHFKTEGFEQISNSTDGDSVGVEELEEDDLLDDELLEKTKENEGDAREGKDHNPKENGEVKEPSTGDEPKETTAGEKSVKRSLFFEDEGSQVQREAWDCATLLEAMEISVEDIEEDEVEDISLDLLQNDNEQLHLTDAWIYDLQLKKQGSPNRVIKEDRTTVKKLVEPKTKLMVTVQSDGLKDMLPESQKISVEDEAQTSDVLQREAKRAGKKQQWGPVLPVRRSSRISDSGKTTLANAQEIKRIWNLNNNSGINKKSQKIPSGSKSLLVSVASDIGIVFEDGNPVVENLVELDDNRRKESLKCYSR